MEAKHNSHSGKSSRPAGYAGKHRLSDAKNEQRDSASNALPDGDELFPYAWMPELFSDHLGADDPDTDFPAF